ncbi:hypothetical protein LshimejAT787_0310320 [Lyophyllum shimeji]|uniref:F-box domain-containing protein n=1 Tax=Lyophyllum shimeji TaxID=47721 RepID=A0A9P3UMG7_LYOSH|nr:hypothetical protein LshimejAT787_0310320 [Lyophyllum shimeji]
MPPRKRSRKKAKTVQSEAHDEEEEVLRSLPAGPVNTTGFPALPAELLLGIIPHIPCLPVPALPKDLEKTYADRAKLLRGLSQMCRSLRRAFLPVVWERIETLQRNASAKSLATELIRQLEIVTVRDPVLAAYVKIVNVKLTYYSCDTVMEEFARCLALFRNLETIQILYTSGYCPNIVDTQAAFKDRQFPLVRTVVIPGYAAAILQSCPGAQSVTWTSQMQVDSTIAWCPNIRRFSGYAHYPSPGRPVEWVNWHLVDEKHENRPMTRRVVLQSTSYQGRSMYGIQRNIECFKAIPRLSCMTIEFPGEQEADIPPLIQLLVDAAQKVLQQQPWLDGQHAKCACLEYKDGTRKIPVVKGV